VHIQRARILTAGDERDEARAILAPIVDEARQLGLYERFLQARLAMAELEEGAVAVEELQSLEREALGRGYALLAARAADAATRRARG
jgi:hypothetical protein